MNANDLLPRFVDLLDQLNDAEDLEVMFEVDHARSQGFSPRIRPSQPVDLGFEAAVEDRGMLLADIDWMEWANIQRRTFRRREYRRMLADGYNGKKIVSEGDSWFLYPCRLKDVVNHLRRRFAIYSLGGAGDVLQDMAEKKEYLPVIAQERPDVFMLSGGGNDVLGGGTIDRYLYDFDAGKSPEQHIRSDFDVVFANLKRMYRTVLQDVRESSEAVHILLHGYDYAVPMDDKYLGRPMARRGIVDPGFQRDIVRVLINRFYEEVLEPMAGEFGRVHIVDNRDAVPDPNDWDDEIHPKTRGFREVARRFRRVVDSI